jgi:hypothetical protein
MARQNFRPGREPSAKELKKLPPVPRNDKKLAAAQNKAPKRVK